VLLNRRTRRGFGVFVSLAFLTVAMKRPGQAPAAGEAH
jgi:hypothetical protein